jgi:DNA polymerase-3 subunit gamma/tau
MALNCPDRSDDGEPCGTCDSCERIWGGHTALDVVEIDAASNRGVEDARNLRERAMYAPSGEGRSKVYIVDEAHMLTREAWNALLKILEEPPPRVIFIFATTEPHKIQQLAAPILSRCQRFDFHRIGVSDIVARLSKILTEEDATATEDALHVIARKADGGMRDALSLLDQVIALTGGEVDVESVRRVLGLVEEERYVEVLDILIEGRHERVFGFIQSLVDEGYDLVEFHHGLLDVFRILLRLRLSPDADVDVQDDVRAQLAERAAAFTPGDLLRMLSAAADLESQGSLRRSPNPRLPIEMLLLRLSFLDRTVGFEELISALGGAPSPGGGSAHGGTGSDGSGSVAGGVDVPGSTPSPGLRSSREASETAGGRSVELASQPGGNVVAGANGLTDASPGPDITATPDVEAAWRRWLDAGKDIPKDLSGFLRSAHVVEGSDGSVVVRPLPGPAMERLSTPGVMKQIADGLAPHLGRRPELRLEAPEATGAGAARVTQEEVHADTLKALYRQEPRLERAVEELDLELMD